MRYRSRVSRHPDARLVATCWQKTRSLRHEIVEPTKSTDAPPETCELGIHQQSTTRVPAQRRHAGSMQNSPFDGNLTSTFPASVGRIASTVESGNPPNTYR